MQPFLTFLSLICQMTSEDIKHQLIIIIPHRWTEGNNFIYYLPWELVYKVKFRPEVICVIVGDLTVGLLSANIMLKLKFLLKRWNSIQDGIYVPGKAHIYALHPIPYLCTPPHPIFMHSTPSHIYALHPIYQKLPQHCLWNNSNVHLTDDDPLLPFQALPLSTLLSSRWSMKFTQPNNRGKHQVVGSITSEVARQRCCQIVSMVFSDACSDSSNGCRTTLPVLCPPPPPPPFFRWQC